MIRIVPVTDRRSREWFIDVPFQLYRNDSLWVPPLRSDMRKLISPKHNPFFAEADIQNFVALDADMAPVGRISAIIHHEYNRRFGEDRAFFGFYETSPDPAVSAALFQTVESWSQARGKRTLIGPYSYTSTQDAALLLENLDSQPPCLLQTYNPEYYRQHLESAGFNLAFTFSTYGVDSVKTPRTDKLQNQAAMLRQRHNIQVRNASKAELKQNLDELRRLFNDCFADNLEVAPISRESFRFQLDSVRPFIDLAGIRVIEVDNQPAAFFLILPDLNELLTRLGGKLGLLDLIRLPRYRKQIRKCVIALIGARPMLHGQGVGRIIADEIIRYAYGRYEEVHTMWIDDRNPSSYVLAANGGMQRTKRYGVFQKSLGAGSAAAKEAQA
ncbi:hypothetical protein BI347_08150 [Chromobacterium sphagni]|uniref:N-acetyltransferase domain-containing protein n=1 Tax=Chromobacterium sphagni TaxID=1903179 RepID=A0A1S1X1S5_9NEIS|nr:hypothetical protein [Chromobacterium sphagni]OHX13487.1 hypothetical protein BI347_08150 [Chromobacterium sphagni]